jgi:hypothetical protein
MHNDFLTLQKKCRVYRMKRVVKYVVPIFLLFGAAVGYAVFNALPQNVVEKSPKPVRVKELVVKEIVLKKNAVVPKREIVKEKIVVASPKYKDVAYAMQIDENAVLEMKEKPRVKKKTEHIEKIHREVKPSKKKQKNSSFEVSVKKYDNLKQMQEMYKKEKKYSLALKIGEQYFKKREYSQSLRWSKEANILDHKAEGAWLLYAKSEYAKGNKKRAVKLLKLYLGNTQSLEVESLLSKWTRETK